MSLNGKVRSLFYDRAPNSLVHEHLSYAFPDITKEELQGVLDQLVKEGFLEPKKYQNGHYPKFCRTGYHIASDELGEYPVDTEIQIGNFKIPRMLDGDTIRAEDINSIAMSFERVVTPKIEVLKKQIETESRKYWGALITVFAVFITLFSLINVAVKPIYFSSELNLSPKEMFLQCFFNIAPLALVLVLFLLGLFFIFRRK